MKMMFRACFGGGIFARGCSSLIGAARPARDAPRDAPEADHLCHAPAVAAVQPPAPQARARGQSQGISRPSNGQDGAREPAAGAGQVTASSAGTGLNASRIQAMQPENVTVCDACDILDGLCLQQKELGRGTYGLVVPGTYRGVNCAVKIMLSAGLDRAAIRELLLSPRLVHPNVVSTYASRAARLTHDFFDLLEGERDANQDPNVPRTLAPMPLQSEDGFGEPRGLTDGTDPLVVLHQVLHALGAETGKMVMIVVQEYCDRGTLDNAIRKSIFNATPHWGMRLARRAMLRSAAEIARGLLHLHDSGVIHGDLKPANVLLSSSREDRRGFIAKVGDFGLSHVLPSAGVNSVYTDSWGSIAYMAPEAFTGRVSRATDVWAFGVILWEMLTGERPFAGCRHSNVVLGVKSGTLQLTWPESAPMSAGVIALGRRCVSHNPEARPRLDEVVQGLVDIERAMRAELLALQQQRQQQEEQAPSDGPFSSPIKSSGEAVEPPSIDFISDLVVI